MAQRLLVGTGITENYYPKTLHFKYFETLNRITTDRVLAFSVLLDYPDAAFETIRQNYPNIKFIRMSSGEVRAANPNKCLQHGAFIHRLSEKFLLGPSDYVVFTDSDMTVQRPFTDEEVDAFFTGFTFSAMNWHPQETLAEELPALQPTAPPFAFSQAFPGFETMACLNTGVLGASIQDWIRLYTLYVVRYPLAAAYMQHYARQQWLLCWLLQTHKFHLFDPNSDFVRTVHTHGHEPYRTQRLMSTGASMDPDGTVRYRGTPVVFAHNLK